MFVRKRLATPAIAAFFAVASAILGMASALPARAGDGQPAPPPSRAGETPAPSPSRAGETPAPVIQKGQDHEEGNFHGRVPFIPDTDPVFAGNSEGIKAMANALRRGLGQKPMVRAYERLYPRLYPFDRPFELKPAQPVAAKGRPETTPSWTFLGPTNIPGRITALVRHPTVPATLYVGAADGGVWKTTDAGNSWTPLTDFAKTLSIGSLAINAQNPNELWAGTGEGNFALDNLPGGQVLHTTDAGATWTTITHSFGDMRGIAVKTDAPSILFAAAGTRNGSPSGILKSTDSGATWTLCSNGIPSGIGSEILVDPASPSTVYAALGNIYGDSNNGIYKSTNAGETWTKLGGGLPTASVGRISFAIAPSKNTTIYAAIQDSSTFLLSGLYKTTDGGSTWAKKNLVGAAASFCSEQCWYDMEVAVDPSSADKVYLGGIDVYRSTDGGSSFTQVSVWYYDQGNSRYVHADQHALVATAPGELWAGCDGGASFSSSSGDSWSFRGKGLNTTQYYNHAMHPTKAKWTIGGTQDNGTHLYSSDDKFKQIYGGDGGFCAISPTDPNTMYEEYVYLDINKSTNGGVSWSSASNGIDPSDPVLFIAPFIMDPTSPNTLYAGTNQVYRTTNGAANWSSIAANVTSGRVSALGVGPKTGSVLFSGGSRGEIYRTDNAKDATPEWRYCSSGLPNRYITGIAVASDEQTVYVTVSGTGSAHVYKTTDRGSQWTALTAGLPDEPFDSVVVHPSDPSVVFAGSDYGVYASFDAGATWAPYGTGLPRAAVDSLQISAQQGLLQAGTHGRGIWQVEAVTTGALSVQPSAVPPSGGAPLAVSFTANASGGTSPYTFAWDFGDGASGTGQTASHTYTAVGSFSAKVTATDSAAATASGSVNISVIVPPPSISSVTTMNNPLRLKVAGSLFKQGCTVKISGTAVTTTYKGETSLVAKGSSLKTLLPKGTQVQVTVQNPDGGESAAFGFTRF